MSKIVNIVRDGDLFVMAVQLASGQREKWTYEREETSLGVSYLMISKEDAK